MTAAVCVFPDAVAVLPGKEQRVDGFLNGDAQKSSDRGNFMVADPHDAGGTGAAGAALLSSKANAIVKEIGALIEFVHEAVVPFCKASDHSR